MFYFKLGLISLPLRKKDTLRLLLSCHTPPSSVRLGMQKGHWQGMCIVSTLEKVVMTLCRVPRCSQVLGAVLGCQFERGRYDRVFFFSSCGWSTAEHKVVAKTTSRNASWKTLRQKHYWPTNHQKMMIKQGICPAASKKMRLYIQARNRSRGF